MLRSFEKVFLISNEYSRWFSRFSSPAAGIFLGTDSAALRLRAESAPGDPVL
ncbi:hypothetical protein GCWU000341_00898 [Oribacterium sp. oral taxon 078 str. F0262]|nr:hypothetical protein GCWU000341_00898 [Oribacterium sp. oral taxon 078 str. F0262]